MSNCSRVLFPFTPATPLFSTGIRLAFVALAFTGCASSNEKSVQEALQKNPDLVFKVIEDNPERFLEVVNKAAMGARQRFQQQEAARMQAAQEADLKNPKRPELSDERRLSGTPQSKITIVEYADFQCPACRIAHQSIDAVKRKHGDNVQFYYKHMPLSMHQLAYPAAQYFEAIRLQSPKMALAFYDRLFENQNAIKDTAFLEKTAKAVGANMARLKKDLDSDKVKKTIESDMAEFEVFGFTGTPALVVNGVAMHGAQPPEEIEAVIARTTTKK